MVLWFLQSSWSNVFSITIVCSCWFLRILFLIIHSSCSGDLNKFSWPLSDVRVTYTERGRWNKCKWKRDIGVGNGRNIIHMEIQIIWMFSLKTYIDVNDWYDGICAIIIETCYYSGMEIRMFSQGVKAA